MLGIQTSGNRINHPTTKVTPRQKPLFKHSDFLYLANKAPSPTSSTQSHSQQLKLPTTTPPIIIQLSKPLKHTHKPYRNQIYHEQLDTTLPSNKNNNNDHANPTPTLLLLCALLLILLPIKAAPTNQTTASPPQPPRTLSSSIPNTNHNCTQPPNSTTRLHCGPALGYDGLKRGGVRIGGWGRSPAGASVGGGAKSGTVGRRQASVGSLVALGGLVLAGGVVMA